MNRRNFLKNMAITAGSISPLAKLGAGLGLLSSHTFATAPDASYKALVIINLKGGNDAMNMFVPTNNVYNSYQTTRPSIAVENSNLISDTTKKLNDIDCPAINISTGQGNPYYARTTDTNKFPKDIDAMYRKGFYDTGDGLGINGIMPEFAELYRTGKLSIVSNVGTLVEPTTKEALEDNTVEAPLFLFSHNHQQRHIATAQANTLGKVGWAGKLADAWRINDPIGLNISYGGAERMLLGQSTAPLIMPVGNPIAYNTIGNPSGEKIGDFLNRVASNTQSTNIFESFYAKSSQRASDLSSLLTTTWIQAPDVSLLGNNSYGNPLFTIPDTTTLGFSNTSQQLTESIFNQFEAATKMIKLSESNLSYKRQVFYLQLGGFDSHSGQAEDHSRNLRSLSLALSDFYKALEAMGLDDKVLTVSTSDFGRTILSNGDGTDHGWAGHSFMICGDKNFQGGKTFGTVLEDVSITSTHAYTKKGRFIPTTSIEQMLAPALQWFGVDDTLMSTVLPNLSNFRTNISDPKSAFLQEVFV
ncbi:MAG: Unknown protein [uncultured Sulfurovum sp.]|uniref:DUF1501 domain-containing protein n=1 Tax=uncultured Sulfurovum sp. TaxID=269237 RepID=A0A6S6SUD1_9BACT|nr:MAG: Unknown protein [uncultured Sulfurovum sp.]